mgnify:CR=1 FL=1
MYYRWTYVAISFFCWVGSAFVYCALHSKDIPMTLCSRILSGWMSGFSEWLRRYFYLGTSAILFDVMVWLCKSKECHIRYGNWRFELQAYQTNEAHWSGPVYHIFVVFPNNCIVSGLISVVDLTNQMSGWIQHDLWTLFSRGCLEHIVTSTILRSGEETGNRLCQKASSQWI